MTNLTKMKAPTIPDWLDKLDKRLYGTVVPFVIGLNVGMVIAVLIFVVCFFIYD